MGAFLGWLSKSTCCRGSSPCS